MTVLTPSYVSRVLAAAGFRPLPSGTSRMREGIRVTAAGEHAVRVGVDFDSENAAARRCRELFTVLRDEGFAVSFASPTSLRVERAAEADTLGASYLEATGRS